MSAVATYQELKSSNQSFAVKRIKILPGVLLILSNLATMRTRSLLIAEAPQTSENFWWSENTDKQAGV